MCGIWALVQLIRQSSGNSNESCDVVKQFSDFNNLKHRGPDNSYFESYNNVTIGFHRLAIMDDTFSSNQPFIFEDSNRTVIFICNGEIYNFKELIEKYELPSTIQNDCMVIGKIYYEMARKGQEADFVRFIKEDVRGEFAFMLFEFDRLKNLKKVIVARDEIGVRPLYHNAVDDIIPAERLWFSSEVKGMLNCSDKVGEFPPGTVHVYSICDIGGVSLQTHNFSSVYDTRINYLHDGLQLQTIQNVVINSVKRRLCADKPLAFLLSGGVDSSLVAAISARILGKPIRTFCCGMSAGTDLKYARMVADHIGSNHTEVFFTAEEGLAAIQDVIRTIESWDTTTVRASVGQYLVSKHIGTQTDCKVLLVGEGPDEVCSSYLFNWYAPGGVALGESAKEYVKNIHYYDVKRSDRCISRWGLEARVPLLDPEFIKAYWEISPEKCMPTFKGMEKWWLREAFNGTSLLPDAVLFRKKEAFSDGVSGEKSWFQIIQEWVDDKVTDEEMVAAAEKYPYYTPKTKEAYYYRRVFCDIFGEGRQNIIPGYWQPKWSADKKEVTEYIDPSARVLEIYSAN
jgi:asparagine synthase (glutamine-hydrolysing)